MTAPMVVASWINLQYYGSVVNNRVFGSGNKVLHNVTGTIGVLEGNAGDLKVGLPWQSVHDGVRFVHEPLRLNVFIEAPRDAIDGVIGKHEMVRQLADNRWIHLFAIEQDGGAYYRYQKDRQWAKVAVLACRNQFYLYRDDSCPVSVWLVQWKISVPLVPAGMAPTAIAASHNSTACSPHALKRRAIDAFRCSGAAAECDGRRRAGLDMRDKADVPVTPDGRYLVVRGRLWRCANPSVPADESGRLVAELMSARRAKGMAMKAGDREGQETARRRVEAAKVALGERGPVWWTDGAPDLNRHMASNTVYAGWFAEMRRRAK